MNNRAIFDNVVKPAIQGLAPDQARRVGIALDAAVAFGVLEAADNPSLNDLLAVERKYWENVSRLEKAARHERLHFWRAHWWRGLFRG